MVLPLEDSRSSAACSIGDCADFARASAETVLQNADIATNRGEEPGKLARSLMGPCTSKLRATLETKLHCAPYVGADLHYQPIRRADMVVQGFEALAHGIRGIESTTTEMLSW